MTLTNQDRRREIEEEYATWANICLNKHGLPWPIKVDAVKDATDQEIFAEIKKLKVLGRTPTEG